MADEKYQLTSVGDAIGEIHRFKTWPDQFDAIRDGRKTWDMRREDRDCAGCVVNVGDLLLYERWDPEPMTKETRDQLRAGGVPDDELPAVGVPQGYAHGGRVLCVVTNVTRGPLPAAWGVELAEGTAIYAIQKVRLLVAGPA